MANFSEPFTYADGNIWTKGTWIQSTYSVSPQVSSNTLTLPVDLTSTQGTRGSYAAYTGALSSTDWTLSFTLRVNYSSGADDGHTLEIDIGTAASNGFTLLMSCGDSYAINNQMSFRIRDSNNNIVTTQNPIAFSSNTNHTVSVSFVSATGTITLKLDGATLDSVAGTTINNDASTIIKIFGGTFNSGCTWVIDDLFFGIPATSTPFLTFGDYL